MKDEKLREKQVELVEAAETPEADPALALGAASVERVTSDTVENQPPSSDNDRNENDAAIQYDDAALHAGRLSFAQKVLGDKFEVLDVIGQGGMGSVYKVQDRASARVVALKLLKPELCQDKTVLKRFQHEAAQLAELNHDNIVAVYDHGITSDGAPYLVMQYLPGGTLSDRLKLEGKLEPKQTIDLALQICQALDYAHKRKLVHRDIKPSNVILVDADQNSSEALVQLVDFGIAKMLESPASNTTNLTQTGDIFGTPAYMSPEQCEGGDIDHRSDVYSLGCILYEMLTGKQPFEGANAIQVAVKHINGAPERFAEKLPDGHILHSLEEIVLKCMKKERADRYQSVSDLIDDLKLVKSGRAVGYAEPPEADEAHSKKKPGRIFGTLLFIVQGIVSLFALLWYGIFLAAIGVGSGTSMDSSERATVILFASVGVLLHTKVTWKILARLKKRRTFADWGEAFFLLSFFATYALALPICIEGLTPPVSDIVACALSLSLISTWLIFASMFFTFAFVHIRWQLRSAFDCVKKRLDPSHVASKNYARIPMSISRAATRLMLFSSIILILFGSAFPSAASNMLSNYFSTIFFRANASLTEPLLQGALALDRQNCDAYKALSRYRTTRGDLAGALAVLNEGLAKQPGNISLLLARGQKKHEMKQYGDALQDLKQSGSEAKACYARGRVYTAIGDFKKAEKEFTDAIGAQDFVNMTEDAYAGRGLAYYGEHNYRQAIVDFSKAIEKGYVNREYNYIRRALAYQALGDASAARQNFEAAMDTAYGYDDGGRCLLRAFAAKQLGNKADYDRLLELAKTKGFGKEKLKEIALTDIPLVTLKW